MPFHRLEELIHSIPSLQRHLFQIMSKEIIADLELIMLFSKSFAEQRLGLYIQCENQKTLIYYATVR